MSERVWDRFLTPADRAHLAGRSRLRDRTVKGANPAILSIDNYRAGAGDRRQSMSVSTEHWPASMGHAAWDALERIKELFKLARDTDIPCVHVTGLSEEKSGIPGWSGTKDTSRMSENELD